MAYVLHILANYVLTDSLKWFFFCHLLLLAFFSCWYLFCAYINKLLQFLPSTYLFVTWIVEQKVTWKKTYWEIGSDRNTKHFSVVMNISEAEIS